MSMAKISDTSNYIVRLRQEARWGDVLDEIQKMVGVTVTSKMYKVRQLAVYLDNEAVDLKSIDGVSAVEPIGEWSGIMQGAGFGPMGSGGDGNPYPACPLCKGVMPGSGAEIDFIPSAIGHTDDCHFGKAATAQSSTSII